MSRCDYVQDIFFILFHFFILDVGFMGLRSIGRTYGITGILDVTQVNFCEIILVFSDKCLYDLSNNFQEYVLVK